MALPKSDYLSSVWKDDLFSTIPSHLSLSTQVGIANTLLSENKVVFCTGGGGSICSAQVRALVHLGANACIVGRNVEKTEKMAASIATARPGAKVIGIGATDVRSFDSLKAAVDRCVKELGGIDFVMYETFRQGGEGYFFLTEV